MGIQHSHDKGGGGSEKDAGSGSTTPRGGSRGSASSGELQVKAPQPTSMVPVEKLAKLLTQRSQKEDGVNGITEKSFTNYVFPAYGELARQFFRLVHRAGRCKDRHVPAAVFRQHCDKLLAMLDDHAIIDTYVRMFSMETEEGSICPGGFRSLLYTSYKVAMDHYPEGPQTCLQINQTLDAVVNGCFNNKDCHSVGFVVRWIEEHTHRIIFPLHRYVVHTLATLHRALADGGSGPAGVMELATPVLERAAPRGALLPGSAAWLLAGAAPPLYSRPVTPPPPPTGGSASAAWLSRLVCAVPSHWVPLYESREHGLGANRFLHHVLAYRGPTLVVLAAGTWRLVLASPHEWRQSHQYWGGPDCALFQLQPTFSLVERAAKMLYLNTEIRGYPRGLRAGSDPRRPLLDVHQHFDSLTYQGTPCTLDAIEVWGCGDQASRETQLEIKKWQIKEAERQRQVKLSAADWIEHPDRYLLELAGRPQYNNQAS